MEKKWAFNIQNATITEKFFVFLFFKFFLWKISNLSTNLTRIKLSRIFITRMPEIFCSHMWDIGQGWAQVFWL